MNKATRFAASFNSETSPFRIRACFFHCTPVSERRRRPHWDYGSFSRSSPKKFKEHYKRLGKQSLFQNASEFAEHLFQSWRSDDNEYGQPSGRGRPNFWEDAYNKKSKSRNRNPRAPRRDFDFCDDNDYDDEEEFETIFRSAFGGRQGFFWSFTLDGERRYKSGKTSGRWKYYESDEEYDSSSDYYAKKHTLDNMTSYRRVLGLSVSGPLNLDDVKNAYRACALKWHPDRHQGSSKVIAEEKFKVCSSAYQSLCDELALH